MERKECPFCGEMIAASAKKCKFCGEWLDKVPAAVPKTTCPICAEEIDANVEICPFCHEAVNNPSKSVPTQPAHIVQTSAPKPIAAHSFATPNNVQVNTQNGVFKTYLWDVLIHHYADFKGTISRKAYWMFVLFEQISLFAVASTIACFNGIAGLIIYFVLGLTLYLPSLSAAVRRLHDIGKSGWMIFISMIPLVGPIYLLILLCKKGQAGAVQAKWCLADTLYVSILGLLATVGIILSIVGGEKYYVYEDSEWEMNLDASRFFAVASTDKRDLDNEFIDHFGTQIIVSAEEPFADDMEIVISAEDIAAEDPSVGSDLNFEIFPSTIDPDLLYFNYWQDGMEFPLCGKVDCKTKIFNLFNGSIIGMISEGRYEDCFVRVDIGIPGVKDGFKIFRQSPVNQSANPVYSIPGKFSSFIFDKTQSEEIINTIEKW